MSTQIIKPLITEKMTLQGDKLNRYGFIVDTKANKLEIKQAVEEMYGVKVENVNTMNYRGKNKVRYTKSGILAGRTAHRKKAVVTLVEGDKIDFYSNI
ncbi:MAG: 50S ribosomal protein L23 [Prevotellaceae bacterium]|jgi:large subunit ribosomal protein L23|nr:50S ribosomal protein L23 [Prevotellaceae bacterium]